MDTNHGQASTSEAVHQKITVGITLPRRYPEVILELIGNRVIETYLRHENIQIVRDKAATIQVRRVRFRKCQLTMSFEVINQATLFEQDELRNELIILMTRFGSMNFSFSYERVDNQ